MRSVCPSFGNALPARNLFPHYFARIAITSKLVAAIVLSANPHQWTRLESANGLQQGTLGVQHFVPRKTGYHADGIGHIGCRHRVPAVWNLPIPFCGHIAVRTAVRTIIGAAQCRISHRLRGLKGTDRNHVT